MSNIYIQETYFNATEDYLMGDSDVYETGYTLGEKEQLKKNLSRVYGDYEDLSDMGCTMWGFTKENRCEDTGETYIQQTTVTLHSQKPTVTTTYHYL